MRSPMAEKRVSAAKKKARSNESSSKRTSQGFPESFTRTAELDNVDALDGLSENFFSSGQGSSSKRSVRRAFDQFPLFKSRLGVAIVTAIISIALTLGLSSLFATNPLDTTTLAARISGGVALTEGELKAVVKELGETVYWSGPVRGAKYTINAQNVGAIYVRYLPDGKGISDNAPNYRVVATYKEENGYDATLAAGNQVNGVSLTRSDDNGVIYYNKNAPTNVYVAFKGRPFQIEIFDPSADTALSIANDVNAVRPVE